jgi:hypothetical protein
MAAGGLSRGSVQLMQLYPRQMATADPGDVAFCKLADITRGDGRGRPTSSSEDASEEQSSNAACLLVLLFSYSSGP